MEGKGGLRVTGYKFTQNISYGFINFGSSGFSVGSPCQELAG